MFLVKNINTLTVIELKSNNPIDKGNDINAKKKNTITIHILAKFLMCFIIKNILIFIKLTINSEPNIIVHTPLIIEVLIV